MWSMLFGLLMWDCLFADVPDTLRSQFQLAPLDLSTPHFYEVTCAHILHSVCPSHIGTASHALAMTPAVRPLLGPMSEACCAIVEEPC